MMAAYLNFSHRHGYACELDCSNLLKALKNPIENGNHAFLMQGSTTVPQALLRLYFTNMRCLCEWG
jgi:hypothetical protein